MSLQVSLFDCNHVSVVDLWGRITIAGGASEIETAISGLLARGRKWILLNLADLREIDSFGIGTLVALHTKVHSRGGRLMMVKPVSKVRDLLALSGLITALEVFEEERDAMSSLMEVTAVAA